MHADTTYSFNFRALVAHAWYVTMVSAVAVEVTRGMQKSLTWAAQQDSGLFCARTETEEKGAGCQLSFPELVLEKVNCYMYISSLILPQCDIE